MNSARNELLRAVRNGSTDEFKQRGVNKIKDMLGTLQRFYTQCYREVDEGNKQR